MTGVPVTRSGLAAALANVGLAALFLSFAYAQLRSFVDRPRASVLLIVLLEALFALFFVIRRRAAVTSTSFGAWSSTIIGTFTPLLLRPAAHGRDFVSTAIVQLAGSALAVGGILSLNRSFGLLPANRGVRSTGLYALVRHPLYASYALMHLGYVASNFTAWNVGVLVVSLGGQLVRIEGEERLLSSVPEYVAYRAKTRWRLLPFVY